MYACMYVCNIFIQIVHVGFFCSYIYYHRYIYIYVCVFVRMSDTYLHDVCVERTGRADKDMVAGTNIVSRQGEAVTVNTLQPLTFNGAVSRVQDRLKTDENRLAMRVFSGWGKG